MFSALCGDTWLDESGYIRYEGLDATGPLIRSLTGSAVPAVMTARSGEMFVVFISDASINKEGFVAS